MKNQPLLLPELHLQTLRRKPRSSHQKLVDEMAVLKRKTFNQLGECFHKFIPNKFLRPPKSGALSRRRIFSKENTFWAFMSQVLDADGGCREVVRKLQAFAALKSLPMPSSSTAAYCKARQKLDTPGLEAIFKHTARHLQQRSEGGPIKDRRVIVVDGTGLTMPDTASNQNLWPQQGNQKPGCGFPQISVCACFCLQTGALLSYETGNKKSHELPMLRKQWQTFKPGDIFLGDRGFSSYFDVSNFKDRGVDSVIGLSRRPPVPAAKAIKILDKNLGANDLLITWSKPVRGKAASYSQAGWEKLPEELFLRQIKVTIANPGFRVQKFYIITTLLDAEAYPAHILADLYFQRWDVELFFRDIKTTMGMDVLRCKSPDMVKKEILMTFIAYNCIRHLMHEAAEKNDKGVRNLSFKGCLQALRGWEPCMDGPFFARQFSVNPAG
ncbi:MAG: IS4 family transposase [Emcibacter sp.]|nr:IS4 family transposase [Emcibacter sp.]